MGRTLRTVAVASILAVALAPMAAAAPTVVDTVLGEEGEIYRLHSGPLEAIVGDRTGPEPALALTVVPEEGDRQRILVPGTSGTESETAPSLTLDKSSNTVYVAWEARRTIHSQLFLAWYRDGEWSEVVEFSGDPFSSKYNPQLAVTDEAYRVRDDDGELVTRHRTILHLVWWDEGGRGKEALYTPLIVEDGSFIRFNPVFSLGDMLPDDLEASDATVHESMRRFPNIESGSDGQSVVATFTDVDTGRLVSVEIRAVSGALVHVADRARAQIVGIGRDNPGLALTAIADEARAQIVGIGRGVLDPGVTSYIADRARAQIVGIGRDNPDKPLEHVADEARAQIIGIGASLSRGPQMASRTDRSIVEIAGGDGDETTHDIEFTPVSSRPAPATPERPTTIFTSPDGEDLIVAWNAGEKVRYRESTDDGWSEVRTLRLSDEMSRTAAYEVLEQRVRSER